MEVESVEEFFEYSIEWTRTFLDEMTPRSKMGGGFFPVAKEYSVLLFAGLGGRCLDGVTWRSAPFHDFT